MRIFLLTLSIIFLCIGSVNADGISISHVDGMWDNGTKVAPNQPVTWYIHLDTPPEGLTSFTNGFQVFLSNDGTVGGMLNPGPGFSPIDYNILVNPSPYDFNFVVPYYEVDGFGADTIGFGGWMGEYDTFISHEDTWTITTQVDDAAIGNYLCLDSTFFPPGGDWFWTIWPGGWINPSWDGPHCYLIEECCFGQRGDIVGDEGIFIDDLMFLRDFLFTGGPAPDCLKAGDIVIDGEILINDLVYLVNYLFKGGDAPPSCD